MKQREKISTFYKDEFLRVYEIITDDTITDKVHEIEKIGKISKLEKSLKNPFYKNIDNEVKVVRDWYELNFGKNKVKKPQLNQYSPETVSRKLFELVYLNELIENGLLNENTYYPIFKRIAPGLVGRIPLYKYLFNTPNIEMFKTEQVKKAEANIDIIENEIKKFHEGELLKNLKYRRSFEEFFEKNNYLENYKYAEYMLKTYINAKGIYRDPAFIRFANISQERLDDCAKIVQFLNPVLYGEYMDKRKANNEKNLNSVNYQFIGISNEIRKYLSNGKDMPIDEFLSKAPFIHFAYNSENSTFVYIDKFDLFCNEPTVKNVIKDYLRRNGLAVLTYVNIYNYMKSLIRFDGVDLTEDDKKNIIQIIKVSDFCPTVKVINHVIRKYLNNEYNMDDYNKEKKEINPIEEVIKQNPYTYSLKKVVIKNTN